MSKTISAEDFGPKYSSPIPAESIARLAKLIINALEAIKISHVGYASSGA
jgi:hypothetical protein